MAASAGTCASKVNIDFSAKFKNGPLPVQTGCNAGEWEKNKTPGILEVKVQRPWNKAR